MKQLNADVAYPSPRRWKTGLALAALLASTAAADAQAVSDSAAATAECLAWIDKTYRIDAMTEDLGLDLADDHEAVLACVRRDTARMSPANAVRYCENVLKVHCPGLDLLAEIGEAQVERCEELLAGSLGLQTDRHEGWKTCAQHKVFDRYSMKGEASGEAACRAALLDECGTNLDAAVEANELSPEQRVFAECCSADALDPETCPMIDDGFERGPCHDRPVCVNRLTTEWIRCSARAGEASASWSQWGGPSRDFRAPAADLATSWPAGGPEKLWSRPLGEGYSAILFEGGRLYTMYRDGAEEVVACLDAGSGETVWEHRYEHGPHERHLTQFGNGPSSTPLLAGDLLFTVGIAGRMHALSKKDGGVVWVRDLWDEDLGGNVLGNGYSSSPVAYEDTVIVLVGGEDAGLVAFNREDGSVRWRSLSFKNSYSSPQIVTVAGDEELVTFMAEELIGVDPESGELRWRYPHVNQFRHNISMPAVADGGVVFLSSPQAGARGLRLVSDGETIAVEEIWSTRRVQLFHGSSVLIGDWVYGSSGTAAPAFLTAVNVRTGEIAWRERGFARANCVEADGMLVILDEDGMLYLASATPEKLELLAKTKLLEKVAWTAPTIVGTTLYARDRKQVVAVDLGSSS
ncbi:MAG TPA: PQQ-binding-like beta-propeller repeat protein [Thermoanaerobaculia bacterium]|jgi:outer membrane protein assembly factor BamB